MIKTSRFLKVPIILGNILGILINPFNKLKQIVLIYLSYTLIISSVELPYNVSTVQSPLH